MTFDLSLCKRQCYSDLIASICSSHFHCSFYSFQIPRSTLQGNSLKHWFYSSMNWRRGEHSSAALWFCLLILIVRQLVDMHTCFFYFLFIYLFIYSLFIYLFAAAGEWLVWLQRPNYCAKCSVTMFLYKVK